MIFETARVNSNCNDLHSRLEKVDAKLDKIVHEVGSRLENHSKAVESITNIVLQLFM